MSSRILAGIVVAAVMLVSLPALAAYTYEGSEGVASQFFDVHCTACHNEDLANAGIRFDTAGLASANADVAKLAIDWSDGTYDSSAQRMPSGAASELSAAAKLPFTNWRSNGKVASAVATMTTGAADSVGKYAATLNASVMENGINTTFSFRYSTNVATVNAGNGSTAAAGSPAGSGGGNNSYPVSAGISGLACATQYFYRITGTTGTSGSVQNFTTAACPAITGTSGSLTGAENQTFTVNFVTAGGVSSYSIQSGPSGHGASIDGSNQFVWTPPATATYQSPTSNTAYGFTIRATDGTSNSDYVLTVTTTPVNNQLVFTQPGTANAVKSIPFSLDIGALHVSDVDDADGQLTWNITAGQKGNMAISDSGVLTWTPGDEALTTQNVTVQVRDGLEDGTSAVSRTFPIAVGGTNVGPTIGDITPPVKSVNEDAVLTFTVGVTDPDDANNGSALTWSLDNEPPGMEVSNKGVISWTPTQASLDAAAPQSDKGYDDIRVSVRDGGENGAGPSAHFFYVGVVAVNDAPVVAAIPSPAALTTNSHSLDVSVTDEDNSSAQLGWQALTGAPSGMSIANLTCAVPAANKRCGRISWTGPVNGVPGTFNVMVTARDTGDGVATTGIKAAKTGTASFSFVIADTDTDGIPDYRDNCAAVSNAGQSNNDGDALGDVCDPDDDNDGIPDAIEIANRLNPLDAGDASADIDGDGLSNLDEFNACNIATDPDCRNVRIDSVPPVISTGGDVVLTAAGYYTALAHSAGTVLAGSLSAAAVDGNDGVVAVLPDKTGPFRSGHHVITWTARDSVGNESSATQNLFVKPLATLGGTGLVGINTTVNVPVRLNGEAPSYPVTVNYSVSGTALAGTDYAALSGSVTFTAARPVQEDIVVNIASSATDKTLIITLTGISGDAVLGLSRQRTLAITRQSSPPQLSFRVEQAGEERQVVYRDDGDITVRALVTDPNGGPANCNHWQTGSLSVLISGCTVSINPSAPAGSYTLTTTALDTQNTVTRSVTLLLLDTRPVLTAADTDGDGITNADEGLVDSNHNGILDYLEAQGGEQPESILLRLGSGASLLLLATADTGLEMQAGRFAVAAQSATTPQAGIQIFAAQVADGGTVIADADYAAVGAIYDFVVSGLSAMNSVAHVVLPLPVALPAQAQWRQLAATGTWRSFTAAGGDGIASAPRSGDGQCPAPAAAAYQPGLLAGNICVQLTISDGGANDADGLVNGSVSVTAAPTVARADSASVPPTESQNGGAADLYMLVLLGLALITLRRKELQR